MISNNTLNNFSPQGGGWEKIEASAQNKCGTKLFRTK